MRSKKEHTKPVSDSPAPFSFSLPPFALGDPVDERQSVGGNEGEILPWCCIFQLRSEPHCWSWAPKPATNRIQSEVSILHLCLKFVWFQTWVRTLTRPPPYNLTRQLDTWDFKSELSQIQLEKLWSGSFSGAKKATAVSVPEGERGGATGRV